jgi:hypothetical protein
MIGLLYEFCTKCDKAGVVPAEKEIDLFLRMVKRKDLREYFIKFCFYNWENRYIEINKLN